MVFTLKRPASITGGGVYIDIFNMYNNIDDTNTNDNHKNTTKDYGDPF